MGAMELQYMSTATLCLTQGIDRGLHLCLTTAMLLVVTDEARKGAAADS